MSFLLRAIGLSGSIPGFPYTPRSGAPVTTTAAPTLTWTMRPGVGDEDERPVTIFSASLAQADSGVKELARHAMKRAKSLLLPGLLRCHGAVEHQDTVYIATDPCEPLAVALRSGTSDDGDNEDAFHESVALGLKSIGTALVAMHKNNIVHGNVSCDSVFVLSSGEWRLFGFELASTYKEDNSIYQRYAALLPEYRRPPETMQTVNDSQSHLSNTDSWGMASLIYEVLGVPVGQSRGQLIGGCKGSDMRSCRNLPRTLQSGFIGLCASNPKMRHDIERFLRSSEFIVGSEFVQFMQILDELSIKDPVERDRFFENLSNAISSFPLRACKCMILQKLRASFQFSISPTVVDPVLKIAARITLPVEYAIHVAPVIVDLFASPDRMVRYRLLQRAHEYASSLPPDVLNKQIWPHLITGFSSPAPSIREHTVRALVSFTPFLNEKIVTNNVPKHITQMQQDPEGAIRTNATISLCLVADFFPTAQRSNILVHGFVRMLKDPFTPSRLNALRSIQTTFRHITPRHVAELLLPGIAPLTLDHDAEVRQLTLSLLRAVSDRMEAYDAEETAKRTGAASTAAPAAAEAQGPGEEGGGKGAAPAGWGWRWGFGKGSDGTKSVSPQQSPETASPTTAVAQGPVHMASTQNYTKPQQQQSVSSVGDFDEGDKDPWGTGIQLNSVSQSTHTATSNTIAKGGSPINRVSSESLPEESATTSMAPMRLRKKGLGAARIS